MIGAGADAAVVGNGRVPRWSLPGSRLWNASRQRLAPKRPARRLRPVASARVGVEQATVRRVRTVPGQ